MATTAMKRTAAFPNRYVQLKISEKEARRLRATRPGVGLATIIKDLVAAKRGRGREA